MRLPVTTMWLAAPRSIAFWIDAGASCAPSPDASPTPGPPPRRPRGPQPSLPRSEPQRPAEGPGDETIAGRLARDERPDSIPRVPGAPRLLRRLHPLRVGGPHVGARDLVPVALA